MATFAMNSAYHGKESAIPDLHPQFPAGKDPLAGSGRSPNHVNWVRFVPADYHDTHSKAIGYLLWMFGFTGAHRFYYGKPATGVLWFFTFGLFGIGWMVDLFLIPSMDRQADQRFASGETDYGVAWLLLAFGGFLGLHRFFQGRWITGMVFLFTAGLAGLGIVYDVLTLNDQISSRNSCRSWA